MREAAASTDAMRRFWNRRARENAEWYINSSLDFIRTDAKRFWESGERDLAATLDVVGLHLNGGERVIDIGCGMGRMARALAGRAAEVTGVDVSEEMALVARTRWATAQGVGRGRNPVPPRSRASRQALIRWQCSAGWREPPPGSTPSPLAPSAA